MMTHEKFRERNDELNHLKDEALTKYEEYVRHRIKGRLHILNTEMPKREFYVLDAMGLISIREINSGTSTLLDEIDTNIDSPMHRFIRGNEHMQDIVQTIERFYEEVDDCNPSYLGEIKV